MNPGEEHIYTLLVPLANGRLLVPRSCVIEIVGYQVPVQMSGAPPWYLGLINWNAQSYPLVSFEGACGANMPTFAARSRIVLLRALSGRLETEGFGIVAQAYPQLLRVSHDLIKPDPEYVHNERTPILCRTRLVNDSPLVPDLERLEAMIADETTVASRAS